MLHMLLLGLLLFFSPVYADVSPEQMLDALIGAPWTKSPSDIPDAQSFTIEPYAMINTFELQGYNLRAYVRDNDIFRLKLFTYAEPSLTSSREMILMGYVQGIFQTEAEAKNFQEKMAASLEAREFQRTPPDTTLLAFGLLRMYQGSAFFRKGDINGHVYYIKDIRDNRWYARTAISHTGYREFSNKWMTEWSKGWEAETIMPDKFIQELEEKNISQVISPVFWNRIKDLSPHQREYMLTNDKKIPVPELISAYDTLSQKTFPEGDRPIFLLFRNYLVRYLFYSGFKEEMTPQQKKWLESHGLEYIYSELGGANVYQETLLWKLRADYPNSYWGQFAFLELLIRGFDTSGVCREGQDQWTRVLNEGAVFLKIYPDSPFVPDIQFYMGKAAETLFNLGVVEDHPARDDSGLSRERYADKSEKARLQAIGFYEAVLQSPRKEAYADHLKYILPRLRAGFGTGCEYYFCFYD